MRRFNNIGDCRRYLANLINRADPSYRGTDRVDAAVAGRLGYLVNLMKGLISEGELEERIRRLEDEFDVKGGNGK